MHAHGRIAVAGATGRVGRHVTDVLEERGHDVVEISRSLGVDVVTGEGLALAHNGVETVVDAASQPENDQDAATAFFSASTRNLQEIGRQAGVKRIVVVSIIGIDRFTGGFLAAKKVHEQAMLAGPVPVRILRAAQFHEFVPVLVDWATQDGVCYLPDMRTQLVAGRAVAEALADLAVAPDPAAGKAPFPEIAGPREERLVDVAKLLVAHRGDAVRVEGVVDADDPDRELYEQGALLPGPHAKLAGPSFEEWLDGDPAAARAVPSAGVRSS